MQFGLFIVIAVGKVSLPTALFFGGAKCIDRGMKKKKHPLLKTQFLL